MYRIWAFPNAYAPSGTDLEEEEEEVEEEEENCISFFKSNPAKFHEAALPQYNISKLTNRGQISQSPYIETRHVNNVSIDYSSKMDNSNKSDTPPQNKRKHRLCFPISASSCAETEERRV